MMTFVQVAGKRVERYSECMSELDDRMAVDRARAADVRRLELILALSDDEFASLIAYAKHHGPRLDTLDMNPLDYLRGRASRFVDAWFFSRDADSSGAIYDAWGRRLIVLPAVLFAVILLVIIALKPLGYW